MSKSEAKGPHEIHVISKSGPIRIELLDHQFNRLDRGFGELKTRVTEGLYLLRYSAGANSREQYIRVDPKKPLEPIEVILPFASAAPIGISSSTHEFHQSYAIQYSQTPQVTYGTGGGLMIFARTIDGDGMRPVPIERLSLWDSEMRQVGNLAADAVRHNDDGNACLSAQVDPGGYVLRWQTASRSKETGDAQVVDQSLWVTADWLTLVFIGYNSEQDLLERQAASIYMSRLNEGFTPGPSLWEIESKRAQKWELKEAQVNQALDIALSGLRTGNLAVPDDLLDLLLHAKFKNPLLGVVGAHVILQQRTQDWELFDLVVGNLNKLVPKHPDVTVLEIMGRMRRQQKTRTKTPSLNWPPMVCFGYRGLIARSWDESHIIEEESLAERAAARLLAESPWSCWLALEPLQPRATTKLVAKGLDLSGGSKRGGRKASKKPVAKSPALPDSSPDPAIMRRVEQYVNVMQQMEGYEKIDPAKLPVEIMRQIGLPAAAVKRALQTLREPADADVKTAGVRKTERRASPAKPPKKRPQN